MTPFAFAKALRLRTRHDSTSLPDSRLTLEYNILKDDIADKITQRVSENYFVVPYYRDLESGVREYSLPSDFNGTIQRVEAELDPINNPGRFVQLLPMDLGQMPSDLFASEPSIGNTFGNDINTARYDLMRSSIILYSHDIPAAINGLRMWAASYPEDMIDERWAEDKIDLSIPTSGIATSIPRSFHSPMLDILTIVIKNDGDKPLSHNEREQIVDTRIEEKIRLLKRSYQARDFRLNGSASTDIIKSYGFGYDL